MHIQRRAAGKTEKRKLFPSGRREGTGTSWKAEDLLENKSNPKDVYRPVIVKSD